MAGNERQSVSGAVLKAARILSAAFNLSRAVEFVPMAENEQQRFQTTDLTHRDRSKAETARAALIGEIMAVVKTTKSERPVSRAWRIQRPEMAAN